MISVDAIERLFRPIKSKIYNIIGRGVITALDNSGKLLKVQVHLFQQETYDGIDVLQNYGFESLVDSADEDNEAVMSSIGGNRNMGSIAGIHNREHRPKYLLAGEVVVYSKHGQKIHMKSDGTLLIDAADKQITISGSDILLKATSVDLKDAGGNPVMVDTVIGKFNAHKHYVPGVGWTTTLDTSLVAGTDSAANVKAKI